MFLGISKQVAPIGVVEKGYAMLELEVESIGGHSSIPPPQTAIGIISKAIANLGIIYLFIYLFFIKEKRKKRKKKKKRKEPKKAEFNCCFVLLLFIYFFQFVYSITTY